MARPSPSLVRSITATLSRNAVKRTPSAKVPGIPSAPFSSELPSAFGQRSCRISRLRGAVVSLQPFLTTTAQSLFVTKLSFGSIDPVFMIQGQPLCALTVL